MTALHPRDTVLLALDQPRHLYALHALLAARQQRIGICRLRHLLTLLETKGLAQSREGRRPRTLGRPPLLWSLTPEGRAEARRLARVAALFNENTPGDEPGAKGLLCR